jgi:type IV pilus assembly protein PilY1
MVTYSVSFGVFGSLNPEDYDLYNSNTALRDYPIWPDPSSGYIEKVDDMWHAAVNGRGMFLSADNPDTLVASLQEVMLNLTSRIGSGASLTVNGEELHAGTTVFQAKYATDGWVGDIQAFNINQISGEVITGDGNAIWSASEMLGEGSDWNNVSWDTDREIATYDPGNDLGIPFRWTGATAADQLTAQQKIWLSDNPLTASVDDDGKGELRLKYLRGDNSEEKGKGGEFRTRYSKLGDIVHSSPVYENYGAYGVIYGGANDGMLHAFNADTGVELFAYVPNLAFQYLHQLPLAEPDFKHRFFVDLTPNVKDTGTGAGDHGKLLVGGLGKGGKGYYCLDIDTPLLNDESNAGSWVKWEYPMPTSTVAEKDNMGFSFSRASVVRSYDPAHKWVVIFGNGYSSESGTAALYVLDANTGEMLAMIDTDTAGTENGMSSPIPVDIDGDGKVDFVYAGDLNGNMWKFDLRDPDHNNWRSFFGTDAAADGGNGNGIVDGAETVKPLFKAKGREREVDGTYISAVNWEQPITTRPAVIRMCDKDKPGYLVIFGTGKQLGQADANNTQYQTVYGIWDFGDEASDYLGEIKRIMDGATPSHELTDLDVGVTLLEQYVDTWTPNPSNVDQMLRVLSAEQPDWETFSITEKPKVNAGWFFDLPLSKERVIREIVIRDGKLIFISSIPENDPCAAGGKSIVHEVDACTGGRLQTAQFDINGDGMIDENDMIKLRDSSGNVILDSDGNPIWVAPSGIMFDSMMYPPIFLNMGEEELKHFSTSAGNVMTMKEKSEQTGVFYWRQIDR